MIRTKFTPRQEIVRAGKRENPTQQQFGDSCRISKIMEKHKRTGMVPTTRKMPLNQQGEIFDCTKANSYQESLQIVMDAENAFFNLPAKIRKEFDNDPVKLLEFVNDEKNREKAIELGIIPEPPLPPVKVGDVVSEVMVKMEEKKKKKEVKADD